MLAADIASWLERMVAIRSRTALFLLLTGFLFVASEYVLPAFTSLTHPSAAGTVLTSSHPSPSSAEHREAARCHEESTPKDQGPQNHDCCTLGHLHAIASARLIIAPASAVTPVNSSILLSASVDQTSSQTSPVFDAGPPGSAVPIRI